jgi:hypothetical protein
MTFNIFFDLYKKYLFIPIYFIIGLIFQINKLYSDEIKKLYFDSIDFEEINLYNFIMIDDKNNFENLYKNKNIFIKRYITMKSENNNEELYDNILTLRENILFSVYFYGILHFMYLDYYVENKPNLYTIYKLNIKTNDIIISAQLNNNFSIKEIIKKNYIEIINIIEYSKKYDKNDFDEWENLFNYWIKPIEPSDKINYLKLISMQDTKEIEINSIKYIEIYSVRNLIQKEFFNNLKEIYVNKESPYEKLIYLSTTYRINKTNGNIITILH